MYDVSKILEEPRGNPKIWRYLDFTKFVSMLDRKALIFTRVDKLSDRFEDSFSKPTINARKDGYIEESGMNERELSEIFKKFRRHAYINCWHMNEVESAAMWSLYLKSDEGVAIQSKYKKLRDNLRDCVVTGQVAYIDYDNDIMIDDNPLFAFFYKRKSFEHEHEIRAACLRLHKVDGGYLNLPNQSEDETEYFDPDKESRPYLVHRIDDLNKLIDRIYVSPLAEEWFIDLVKSIAGKYGIKKKVTQSRLNIDPIF